MKQSRPRASSKRRACKTGHPVQGRDRVEEDDGEESKTRGHPLPWPINFECQRANSTDPGLDWSGCRDLNSRPLEPQYLESCLRVPSGVHMCPGQAESSVTAVQECSPPFRAAGTQRGTRGRPVAGSWLDETSTELAEGHRSRIRLPRRALPHNGEHPHAALA
jgi:hypothetical protein